MNHEIRSPQATRTENVGAERRWRSARVELSRRDLHLSKQMVPGRFYLDARYADRAGREEARRARALSDAVRRGKQ